MGKNYQKELLHLEDTINELIEKEDISELISFLKFSKGSSVLTVGSGGSYSVAFTTEFLLSKGGYFAKSVTPFALQSEMSEIHDSSAMLFTAGGGNKDTLNAYSFLADMEPRAVITVCTKLNAPIKKNQKNHMTNYYYEMKLCAGKDGFLATNSLIASVALITKGMHIITGDAFFRLNSHVWNCDMEYITEKMPQKHLDEVLSRETILVLHGGIATPVAVDMESKFSEASLGNIQLADYRNFAHGRHFWIKNRMEYTSIIMIQGPDERLIAENTKKLIPDKIPLFEIRSEHNDVNGMLELFIKMFWVVYYAGQKRGIDPGKPAVADFGRKLYHLNYNIKKNEKYIMLRKSIIDAAIYRKCAGGSSQICDCYKKELLNVISRQENTRFRGIIFDYDGTLHDKKSISDKETIIWDKLIGMLRAGIAIGIATGRGKSVREEIDKKIPRELLDRIWIAYYNGAVVAKADEEGVPDITGKEIPEMFYEIADKIKKISGNSLEVEIRPYQLTVLDNSISGMSMWEVKELLYEYTGFKMVISSHSLDIVPDKYGKRSLIKVWNNNSLVNENEILCIGDSGEEGGNDYELLNDWNGISVDRVSKQANGCWNLAPLGLRNLEATEFYLNHLRLLADNCFKVTWGIKKNAGGISSTDINKNNGLEGF